MYKSLHIKNFQSHEDSLIEFDPQVTAIVGLNNFGKSAILKALQKLVRNDPEGVSFINENANETFLTLETDLGNIKREIYRSKPSGKYVIINKENPAQDLEFVNFSKTGIPQEVLNILDVSSIQQFGTDEFDLNFHVQKDNDFLIRGKGLSSTRSKVLSKITGVDIVQKAIQLGRLKEKRYEQEIDNIKKDQQKIKLDLEKYNNVNELDEIIKNKLQQIQKLQQLETDKVFYSGSLSSLQSIVEKATKLKNLLKDSILQFAINDLLVLRNKIDNLIKLQKVRYRINKLNQFLIMSAVEFNVDRLQILQTLFNKVVKIQTLNNKILQLDKVIKISTINYDISTFQHLKYAKEKLQQFKICTQKISKLNNVTKIELPNLGSVQECKKTLQNYKNIQQQMLLLTTFLYNKEQEVQQLCEIFNEQEQELISYKKELKICPTCGEFFKEN